MAKADKQGRLRGSGLQQELQLDAGVPEATGEGESERVCGGSGQGGETLEVEELLKIHYEFHFRTPEEE